MFLLDIFTYDDRKRDIGIREEWRREYMNGVEEVMNVSLHPFYILSLHFIFNLSLALY